MSIIYSEKEIEKFVNLNFPGGLKKHEVAFVSTSVRNKYLTTEEREFYHLGRTEMFNRQIVRNLDEYVDTVVRLSSQIETFKTKSGEPMPEKAAVIYANIHPSHSINAFYEFSHTMQHELISMVTNEHYENHLIFNKMDTVLKTAYQKARGTKLFIDIDFDTHEDIEPLKQFRIMLDKHNVLHHVIHTASGFHVQLRKSTIGYPYVHDLYEIQNKYPMYEIVVNENAMVPVPGTYQAGAKVYYV